MSDPLSMVYDTLWESVLEHPQFDTMVRPGNVIRFDTRTPIHSTIQSGDTPELILTSEGGVTALRATSSSTRITRKYHWIVTTGDMRLDKVLFPLSWLLVESMVVAKARLQELVWEDHKFFTSMRALDARDGESAAQRQSNIRGWASVQSIEVEMHFSTRVLERRATANG